MTSPNDRAWKIIEKVNIGMLTTSNASGNFHARPVEARLDREDGCIYIVTDLRSAKEHEIERDPRFGLTVVDQQTNAYLALNARATVITDPATIKKYWRVTDNMWWKGPDDPNVCVLRAELTSGALWDGPASKAVELFEFLKTTVTGEKPNLGENRKTDIQFGPD
jgi:general stress protein 26